MVKQSNKSGAEKTVTYNLLKQCSPTIYSRTDYNWQKQNGKETLTCYSAQAEFSIHPHVAENKFVPTLGKLL